MLVLFNWRLITAPLRNSFWFCHPIGCVTLGAEGVFQVSRGPFVHQNLENLSQPVYWGHFETAGKDRLPLGLDAGKHSWRPANAMIRCETFRPNFSDRKCFSHLRHKVSVLGKMNMRLLLLPTIDANCSKSSKAFSSSSYYTPSFQTSYWRQPS